ncbi:MAG: hypothetical protein GY859_00595 [Desulfobacterales bacterium]|nr:hypothetical protein [Desulfobacterales bacterium]
MRIIRWLFLAFFFISFIHSCLLVGLVGKMSPNGKIYENTLDSRREPMVYYPAKVYGAVGDLFWRTPHVKELVKRVYGSIFKKLGQRGDVGGAIRIMDIRFWNAVTFICLAIFLVLTLFLRTRARRDEKLQ